MHLLGHVGRRVVDHHPLRIRRRRDAQAVVAGDVGEQAGEERRLEGQVDEAGPGDLGDRHAGEVDGGEHVGGHLAGVAPERLGQRQRAVGLGVGALRRSHHRVDVVATGDGGEGGPEAGLEECERVGHGSLILP